MTAHNNNLRDAPASRTTAAPDIPVAHARRDRAAVIVWRISADTVGDVDSAGDSGAGDSPLTPRLARHLVAIYSDVHGAVIDFDADINLRHAAEATGRTYATITDVSGAGSGAPLAGSAALILLRWPRSDSEGAGPDTTGLFSRCQPHLADDGSTIVLVTATQPGSGGASYGDYEQLLLAAAQTAGLRHLHDIIPIDATDGRDAFTYATDQGTARMTGSGAPRHDAVTTLMIFGHPGRRA